MISAASINIFHENPAKFDIKTVKDGLKIVVGTNHFLASFHYYGKLITYKWKEGMVSYQYTD